MTTQTDSLQAQLQEQFEWLHRHPELALGEVETTTYIRRSLAEIDGVELLELGLPTGVLAKITGNPDGPVIAVRADIDALPITELSGLPYASQNEGCMHACGHDFHTAALLGVARLLAGRREALPGSVILLFQPAEEAEHGGEKVVGTGVFERERIQQIFGLHTRSGLPVGTVAIASGPFSAAVDRFLYRITGAGGHGSAPQNALDPIPAAARLVGALQEIVSRRINPLDGAVVSVTRITAGTSWNIIPDAAELEGTVRSFDPKVRKTIVDRMNAYAQALRAEGYQVQFDWLPGCPATNNDEALTGLVRQTALAEGFQVVSQQREMGGEDFSCYQELVPGAFFYVGTAGAFPGHNARFTADPAALAPAARLMAQIVTQALLRLKEK